MGIKLVLGLLVAAGIVALVISQYSAPQPDLPATGQAEKSNLSCPVMTEDRVVRGGSLAPLLRDGQNVTIVFGYYACNGIKRGDIVAYNYSGNENPIIKMIKGMPGDNFRLQKADGGWNLLVNGEALANSESQTYVLDSRGFAMLSLYEHDYNSTIPENAYLIMGNLASGSLDSSAFGLVDRKDILGKVVYSSTR